MHRRLGFLLSLTGLLAVFACQDAGTPTSPSDTPAFAAGGAPAASAEVIPGRYIVVFNKDVTDAPGLARRLVAQHGGAIGFVYEHALKGFSASLPDAAVAALGRNPNVAYIEQDQLAHIVTTESNATWGLDRVDQRALPLNTTYAYFTDGSGVNVYIIDTGIEFLHTDFGSPSRAQVGIDEVTSGGTAADCNGHGTHVAGTVGGTTYGIAKNVNLYAVRVLDCSGSGSYSQVIAGVDWVTANHGNATAVANMSLGGGKSDALNTAVENSIAAGVVYAVAAGNGNFLGIPQDACTVSPASAPHAVTVGATDKTDALAYFSNYGTCVKILAPGVNITSDWYTSTTATNTISGTSMATPHVAGAAAAYLSTQPSATPAQVATALTSNATANVISGVSNGTPNLLLYTGFIGAQPCIGGTPDVGRSTVTASSPVTTGQASSVVVTVRDGCGNPVTGATVALAVTGTGNTVVQPTATTDATGVATGSFSSTVAESKTVSATANSTAITQQATVTVTTPPVSVHFASLTGTKTGQGRRNWQATATVAVNDDKNSPSSGATATLGLSGGLSGSVSCTTNSSGQCSVTVTVKNQYLSVTFTMQNIQGAGLSYNSQANSTPNFVTVSK